MSSALQRLDRELKDRQAYIDLRQARLDSLKDLEPTIPVGTSEWCELMMELGDGYTSFKTDSAIMYYNNGLNEAVKHADSVLVNRFKLQLSVQLPLVGRIPLPAGCKCKMAERIGGGAIETYRDVEARFS